MRQLHQIDEMQRDRCTMGEPNPRAGGETGYPNTYQRYPSFHRDFEAQTAQAQKLLLSGQNGDIPEIFVIIIVPRAQ
jgi:hypothetical protein